MDVHQDEDEERDALEELAKGEFKINEKQGRLMEYIAANLKVEDFMNALSEEMWLREILKDVGSTNSFVRSRALSMWGQYQGWLGKGKGKAKEVAQDVDFE